MSNCKHTKHQYGHWEPNPHFDPLEAELGGFDDGPDLWVEGCEVDTVVDIDLHRYKCTQCGEIMYYSGAARSFYEDGITSSISGLNHDQT